MAADLFAAQARSVIAFDRADLGERPDRALARGRARSVARGMYTTDLTSPLKRIVRDHVAEILAHVVPDALLVDRSAGPVLFAGDTIFVVSAVRSRDVFLPGLRIAVRAGAPPFDDDPDWLGGLRRSSISRALVENLAPSRARRGISRTLSDSELTAWVAELGEQYPAGLLDRLRARTRELAAELDLVQRLGVLEAAFAVVLAAGEPVASQERDTAPPAPSTASLHQMLMTRREREQAFFETYRSNRIEGTDLTLGDALRIVRDGERPE